MGQTHRPSLFSARFGLLLLAASLVPKLALAQSAFPFLGDSNQAIWAQNGFLVQWTLFGGLSASDGSTLYFLALTATLVGTLSIIFNSKFQDVKTIGSWFVLVVLMLFAPYNSRLLFYPIEGSGNCVAAPALTTGTAHSSGSGKYAGICGFTPQVVAMHVGNTVSVLIYEIFKSKEFSTQIAAMRARSEWLSDKTLQEIPPAVAEDIKVFKSRCRDTQLLPSDYAYSGTVGTSTGAAAPSSPFKLSDVIHDEVVSYFGSNAVQQARGSLLNRPAVVLYSSKPADWDTESWRLYKLGLGELFSSVFRLKDDAGKAVTEVLDTCGEYCGGKGQIDVATAVRKINDMLASAKGPRDVGYYIGAASPSGELDASSKLLATRTTAANNYVYRQGSAKNITKDFEQGSDASDNADAVGALIKALNNPNNKWLATMPVGRVTFATQKNPGSGASTISVAARKPLATMDCSKLADEASRSVLSQVLMNDERAEVSEAICWKPLIDYIYEKGASLDLSSGSNPAAVINTCGGDPRAMKIAQQMAAQGASRDAAVDVVLAPILRNAVVASNGADSKGKDAVATPNLSSYSPDNIGLTGYAGGVAAFLGKIGTAVSGKLSGVQAAATIAIMQSLVELAVLALLVVTPILFLMGLLIPSNAAGLLIISVMGVFILRLVPSTLVIIDALAGIIRNGASEAAGSGITGWANAQFYDGLILYMVAGLYGSVIGLTMFIMFKLGDPSNLSSLKDLDRAAGQIADSGVKALQKIAAVVGTFGFAGAAGAVAGSLSGVGAAAGAKAFAGQAAKNVLRNAVGNMAGNIGAAISEDVEPPPGTSSEEWKSMSPEARAKARMDYERKPPSIPDAEWSAMSSGDRSQAIENHWNTLSDADRKTELAKEMARQKWVEGAVDYAKPAFDQLKAQGILGDGDLANFNSKVMLEADKAWARKSETDKLDYSATMNDAAGEEIRAAAVSLARAEHGGRLFGDGKSRVGDFLKAKAGGAAWGALSGLRGGWEAFGGLGAIPGGKVIAELLNEGKEAPQRAFAARELAMRANGDVPIGPLATLGLGPAGGLRGKMLSEAAKAKFFEQEAGVWASGVAAQSTPRSGMVAAAMEGAKQKAGSAIAQERAMQIATQGRGLTVQDYAALGLGDAIIKQAQMSVKAQTIQNAESMNMTGGKTYGDFVKQSAVAKAEGAVADELSGHDVSYKMNIKLREKFKEEIAKAGGMVPFVADYDENTAKVAETLRDSAKKSRLRSNLRIRETMLGPRNSSGLETSADILKSASARGAVVSRNRNWTFDPVKIGGGMQGSFTNARELFMGQAEGMARRILDDKPRAAKVNFDRMVAAVDLYNELLVEVGKEMKISTDVLKATTNKDGNRRLMGLEMSKWEEMNKRTFERMAEYVADNALTEFATEVAELKSQAESQISAAKDRLKTSGETHGLHVLESHVVKTK